MHESRKTEILLHCSLSITGLSHTGKETYLSPTIDCNGKTRVCLTILQSLYETGCKEACTATLEASL